MKLFFKKTYYFWIFSRALLIISYTCAINFWNTQTYKIGEILVNVLIIGMIILMITLFIFDFTKKQAPFVIKLIPGIFNILFGFLLIYLVAQLMKEDFVLLVYLLPIWTILYGIFEIISSKK